MLFLLRSCVALRCGGPSWNKGFLVVAGCRSSSTARSGSPSGKTVGQQKSKPTPTLVPIRLNCHLSKISLPRPSQKKKKHKVSVVRRRLSNRGLQRSSSSLRSTLLLPPFLPPTESQFFIIILRKPSLTQFLCSIQSKSANCSRKNGLETTSISIRTFWYVLCCLDFASHLFLGTHKVVGMSHQPYLGLCCCNSVPLPAFNCKPVDGILLVVLNVFACLPISLHLQPRDVANKIKNPKDHNSPTTL